MSRYDRRGLGKSSGSEDITWDAAVLAALLDTLGVQRAHILGMSQGGRVALQFVRSHPDRVASLILHSASAPDGFGLAWSGADRPRFDDWATLARAQGLAAFQREWTAHPLMRIPAGHHEARARLDALIAAYRGGRFLNPASPSGPIAPATMDDLSRITAPTLVVLGESDVPYVQIVARALAYYVPNARFETIPGGGHMVNLIAPDRYNASVLRFIGSVGSSRTP